jgi:hypothetical protein
MVISALLRLPLPVLLAFGALLLGLGVLARVAAGLGKPVVIRAAEAAPLAPEPLEA